jgi:hypothetical protein
MAQAKVVARAGLGQVKQHVAAAQIGGRDEHGSWGLFVLSVKDARSRMVMRRTPRAVMCGTCRMP